MRADALDALMLVKARRWSRPWRRKRFPSGLVSMFARPEQTGQLPVMLQRAVRQLSTGGAALAIRFHHSGATAHCTWAQDADFSHRAPPIIQLNQFV
jgi:hypothetical protein